MKKNLKLFLLSCLMFLFTLAVVPAAEAKAYGVEQTGATKNSVTVAWAPYDDAINYKVLLGTTDQNYNIVWTKLAELPATQTSYTITNLEPGTKYDVRIQYDHYSYDGTTLYPDYNLGTAYDVKTLPGKVMNVKQTKWWYFIKNFEASWDDQTAADGYEYIVKNNSGKTQKKGEISYNSVQVTKVSNTRVYTVQVRAYTTINGTKYYGEWSEKCYCFTQPRITSIKKSGKNVTIKWDKVQGATGYDIYMSTKKKSGYKKVKSVGKNTNKVTISKMNGKKLSAKKKYYFYVATKKKVGKTTYNSGRLYFWNSKQPASYYEYF